MFLAQLSDNAALNAIKTNTDTFNTNVVQILRAGIFGDQWIIWLLWLVVVLLTVILAVLVVRRP